MRIDAVTPWHGASRVEDGEERKPMAGARDDDPIEPITDAKIGGPNDPVPATARTVLSLRNIAHGLKLTALLLFLLPWVTVSCAEQTLVSLSGMDLATGSVAVTNPLTGEAASTAGEADAAVMIAALLIAATLIAGFVLRHAVARKFSIAGLAAAAVLIVYSVLYRLPGRAKEAATAESAQGISEKQIADLIQVDIESGFWLTLSALLAGILFTFLARNQAPAEEADQLAWISPKKD